MLPEEVQERLDLLLQSGQIQSDTDHRIRKNLVRLIEEKTIDPKKESMGPFSSHLAIAVERIRKGEALTNGNDQVDEVVRERPDLYRKADELLGGCLEVSEPAATPAETGFITLYLALLQD